MSRKLSFIMILNYLHLHIGIVLFLNYFCKKFTHQMTHEKKSIDSVENKRVKKSLLIL